MKKIINLINKIRRRIYLRDLANIVNNLQTEEPLSIISQNCFAGRIMQDLNMEYNSPTAGLAFMYPDYIKFLSNLKFYLKEAKLEFIDSSKYKDINTKRQQNHETYPIALLGGDIEIHFIHYPVKEEAEKKWYRRAKRVNLNNLLIIGMDRDRCTESDIIAFDKLPYKHKIFFTSKELKLESCEYIPYFKGKEVGNPYTKAYLFYKYMIKHNSQRQI